MPHVPFVLPRRYTRRSFLDHGLRLGLGVTGAVTLASLLDACATGPGGTAPTPPPGATVIRALLFDQVGYDPTVLQGLANKFRTLHDNKVFVSIETAHYRELYESILAAGLTKPAPYDVVALDQGWVPELANRKQLLSLKDQIPDDARSDIMPSLLDAFAYKDTNWAMPHGLNFHSLYYHKSQLHAAGFSGHPATLEDWTTQMLALRRRALVPYTDS